MKLHLLISVVFTAVWCSAATASVISLDGVSDGSAYGNTATTSWFNGHKSEFSRYGEFNNQLGVTTVHYGVGQLAGDSSGRDYFFLYLEAPIGAKNMIWENLDWKNNYPLSNTDPTAGLTEDDVASYRVHHETHHKPGDMKLDFNGATGSEKLNILNSNGGTVFKANLAGNADNSFGLVDYKDSVDYLFDNSLATNNLSLNRDTPMSFELMFNVSSQNQQLVDYIVNNGLDFHLSPERGLLTNDNVPEPTSLLLFGGLFGLVGLGRRRRS